MKIIDQPLPGIVVMQPKVFEDHRGYFFESFNSSNLADLGIKADFVQDNQSLSHKGVLRGLHFQNPPFAQGKLVRVIKGSVLDVMVDIRKRSPTYGENYSVKLSESNKFMVWIPDGFAHGFKTLEDNTIFFYKCTAIYNKQAEGAILWSDPTLAIDWGSSDHIISERDQTSILFKDFISNF